MRARFRPTLRRAAHFLLVPALLIAGAAAAQQGQAQADREGTAFDDEARVTAIDVVVEVRNRLDNAPGELGLDALVVEEDGERRPVVGLSPLAPDGEPWRLVAYFDLVLSSTAVTHATAAALAEEADALTALGSVEVVVADPSPRQLLEATRDAEAVREALSRIVVDMEAADEINELRRAVRAEARAGSRGERQAPDMPMAELLAAAAGEEGSLVENRHAALLTWAAGDLGRGPRALLLVEGGYDLDPAAFYRDLPGGAGVAIGRNQVEQATQQTARALAAYGWVVFPLSFEVWEGAETDPDAEFEEARRRGLEGVHSDTAMLGKVRVPLGKSKEERQEEEAAEAGEQPPEDSAPADLLRDRVAPLDTLAAESGGAVVARSTELVPSLKGLGERFRLTFQVSRPIDGRLRRLTVSARSSGLRVTAPAWVRSSTPEAVAEARVRRILEGEPDVGDLLASARFRPGSDGGAGSLQVSLDLAKAPLEAPYPARCIVRLTVAEGGEGKPLTFRHQLLTDQDLSGSSWSVDTAVSPAPDSEYLVVVVEELTGGQWASQEVEL
jgi:hypothetical protein